MAMLITTITEKGQVTVPVEVRRLLGVRPRDKISFRIEEGAVKLERVPGTLEAAFGAVRPRKRPEDFRRLLRAAKEERAEAAMRKLGRRRKR